MTTAFWQQSYRVWSEGGDVIDVAMETDDMLWQAILRRVTAVYTDGGVFRPRRCEAGSWAWVGTSKHNDRLVYQRGWMAARGVLRDGVTNNQSEFAAMLKALEAMPDGWSGIVYSDSEVTIGRFRDDWRLSGIPNSWARRMHAARDRLGVLEYRHLKGHPTLQELAAPEQVGVSRRSGRRYPISEHQVECDRLCALTLAEWMQMSRTLK